MKWNDYQANIQSAFESIRSNGDFSDVTLAFEDGQQVEAHKVILAASSPFFQTILTKNKHHHPLIYMRGMKSEDLVAIVDFLYFGEANVYQENVDSFLTIAEELNLKGLTRDSKTSDVDKPPFQPEQAKSNRKQVSNTTELKTENHKSYKLIEGEMEMTVAVQIDNVNISYIQDLDQQVRSMMRKSENMLKGGSKKADMCTVCGKEGQAGSIKDHIEANHMEGVSIPCNNCDKTFRSRTGLRKHITRNHQLT